MEKGKKKGGGGAVRMGRNFAEGVGEKLFSLALSLLNEPSSPSNTLLTSPALLPVPSAC